MEYGRLKTGQLKADIYYYHVESTDVQSNVFADVLFFANLGHPKYTIKFFDVNENVISLYVKYKQVQADFTQGEIDGSRMTLLPVEYHYYTIHVQTLLAADIDAIEKWQTAKKITVKFDIEICGEIEERVEELSKNAHIRFIRSN